MSDTYAARLRGGSQQIADADLRRCNAGWLHAIATEALRANPVCGCGTPRDPLSGVCEDPKCEAWGE